MLLQSFDSILHQLDLDSENIDLVRLGGDRCHLARNHVQIAAIVSTMFRVEGPRSHFGSHFVDRCDDTVHLCM